MNNFYFFRVWYSTFAFLAISLLLSACSTKEADLPPIPSLANTYWVLKVKWQFYPDTITTYMYFKTGGEGDDIMENYTSLNNPSRWWQSNYSAGWDYTLQDASYAGEMAADGLYMWGTCIFRFPLDDALKGSWKAYKR